MMRKYTINENMENPTHCFIHAKRAQFDLLFLKTKNDIHYDKWSVTITHLCELNRIFLTAVTNLLRAVMSVFKTSPTHTVYMVYRMQPGVQSNNITQHISTRRHLHASLTVCLYKCDVLFLSLVNWKNTASYVENAAVGNGLSLSKVGGHNKVIHIQCLEIIFNVYKFLKAVAG